MLTAGIQEDCFLLASISAKQAREVCPPPLVPVVTGDCGWISLAAVRFTDVRLFGCPVTSTAICAAAMLLTEYTDASECSSRGNFFLKGFTSSRLLHRATRLLGLRLFEYAPLRLRGDDQAIDFEIPGLFSSRIERQKQISTERQQQIENLFRNNQRAFVQRRSNLWLLDIEKTHWDIRGREARLYHAGLFEELGAEFQFAFDTSESMGRWRRPRSITRFLWARRL